MKKNGYLLSTLLVAVLFAALAAAMLVQVFLPAAIIPPLNIPNIVLLSLIALVLEHFFVPNAKRCWVCVGLLAVATFCLLPLMAGFACVHTFWRVGIIGGVVFTLTAMAFTSVTQRLASGYKAKAALIVTAFGIYLAAQCFAGILL